MTAPFRSPHHSREVLVFDWRDAEELAAWYMREVLELGSVRLTGDGADGGIDVTCRDAGAQVKHYSSPVGAPEVQQARGASHGLPNVLFFALSGYTQQAATFALRAEVALFRYSIYGDVTPENEHARGLVDSAPRNAARRAEEEAAAATRRVREEAAASARRVREEAAAAARRVREEAGRAEEEAAASARRAEEEAAASARRAEEEAARRDKEREKILEQIRREAAELESQVPVSSAAITAALSYAVDLEARLRSPQFPLGDATHSFVLAEYASYFRPQLEDTRPGVTKRESAHRILQMLEWATTERWLDWKGLRIRYLPSAVEAAAREFLALYDEITNVTKLRSLSLPEWAAILCDWEMREAQIESLLEESAITDLEEVPDTKNLSLRVIASLGKSSDVLAPLPARWPHKARDGIHLDTRACEVAANLDPMGFGVARCTQLLSGYVRGKGGRWTSSWSGDDTVRWHALGSSSEKIEQLRRALEPSLSQMGGSPRRYGMVAPLNQVRAQL
jgi:hypothetical protein